MCECVLHLAHIIVECVYRIKYVDGNKCLVQAADAASCVCGGDSSSGFSFGLRVSLGCCSNDIHMNRVQYIENVIRFAYQVLPHLPWLHIYNRYSIISF